MIRINYQILRMDWEDVTSQLSRWNTKTHHVNHIDIIVEYHIK